MAVLEILKYPHSILRKRSKAVSQIDEDIKKLVQDMKPFIRRGELVWPPARLESLRG